MSKLVAGLLLACAGLAYGQVAFSPEAWKFGSIPQGRTIQAEVTVTNTGRQMTAVSLVPTCTCLAVSPAEIVLAPGARQVFLISYDSSDDRGITRKDFLVQTRPPGQGPAYYTLTGIVRAERQVGSTLPAGDRAGAPGAITVDYYYTPGCRSCEQFLSEEIPRLSRRLGRPITVQRKDVLQPAVFEELEAAASLRGQALRQMPVLVAGATLLQGEAAIRANLAAALQGQAAPAGQATGPPTPLARRLAVLPVAAAGLIDGVNPCAFTTLIFLLASLALAGRGRQEVLLIGSLFSLSVFLSYLGIGIGLFALLRAASTVSLVSVLLRWVLVAALVAFAGMSVYDWSLIRRGRPTEILLQLPSALKRRIHGSIRARVRTAALAGSSLALGFLVSVFEFACTGQVYVPVLTYVARMRQDRAALGLLLLYNLCFIAPLLAVFGASYLGVSSSRVTRLFQAHMGKVKLGLAAVFLALAVFTLVG